MNEVSSNTPGGRNEGIRRKKQGVSPYRQHIKEKDLSDENLGRSFFLYYKQNESSGKNSGKTLKKRENSIDKN